MRKAPKEIGKEREKSSNRHRNTKAIPEKEWPL